MKYAMKIRKSDRELLGMLNGGVQPTVEKKTTYLIVDTDPEGYNAIVTERELVNTYEISNNSPLLLKLKK